MVLRDTRNDRGTQFEAAQIEDDGTLRVTGHHTGPGVSEFFGAAITSYDWAYVIAPDRTATLLTLLGGHTGDDVLDLPATYRSAHQGVRLADRWRGGQGFAARRPGTGCRYSGGYCPAWRDLRIRT